MERERKAAYLMLGKGKKEMGISSDEDSEEVLRLWSVMMSHGRVN